MLRANLLSSRFTAIAFIATMSVAFGIHLRAQDSPASSDTPYVDDWTHHHLVFSNPGNSEDAARLGKFDQWQRVTNDSRYRLQQIKRQLGTRSPIAELDRAFVPDESSQQGSDFRRGGSQLRNVVTGVKKDWSEVLGGGASLTNTIGALNSGSIGPNSSLTIDYYSYLGCPLACITFDASPPSLASGTGTFSGNPASGQTATIGGTEVLTASASTPATASVTLASPFCFAPNTGVTVDGTAFTTNATAGTGTYVVNSTPTSGDTVVIGGITYIFETALAGATANQVLIAAGNHTGMAQNLSVAVNNGGTCGTTSGGVCTRNVSAENPLVSSTDNNSATQTMTARCAGNAAIAGTGDGTHVTVNTVSAASSQGTNSATNGTFAIGTNAATATNIYNDVNGNATTSGLVTATNPSSGVVDLTAKTLGTAGNSYTLTDSTATTTGVTLVGFSGGVNGTNTGLSFEVDGVVADNAANLAAAIARNGATVGVTATSAGAVVTVTALTPGTTANGITFAKTLNNFTWAGSSLSGGTDGTTSGTSNPPTFAYWSGNNYVTPAQLATNIATAFNSNTMLNPYGLATANSPASGDITFTELQNNPILFAPPTTFSVNSFSAYNVGSGQISATGVQAQVQPSALPAKYGPSLTTASCTNDFVVYPTGQSGAASAATIVAYNNLYEVGCTTGTVPSYDWAYNTGTGDSVTTSPVISQDGTKVAFIQSNGTTASLVVVKWSASSTYSDFNPENLGTSTNITTCTAPCMTVTTLAHDDTLSSPYYDYQSDAIYVGDDSGFLEKFTGVFQGTAVTAVAPVSLSTTLLASPVYDSTSGCVFVGDTLGYLYKVNSGAGGSICTSGTFSANATSALLGTGTNTGFFDAVLMDSTSQKVYAFVTASAAMTHGGTCAANGNCVAEFSTSFGSAAAPSNVEPLGTGGANYNLYPGNFDNVYYTSTTATGHLFVVGNTGATTGAILYRIPVTSGAMTGSGNALGTTVLTASGASPWPSPLTEFCNGTCTSNGTITNGGGTDYIFFSVNQGNESGCSSAAGNGCVLAYNVTNPAAVTISGTGLPATTPGTNGCWATGGIVLDNDATNLAGASQIYFVGLNGAAAGGPNGNTSSSCTGSTALTINAIQAAQNGTE